MDQWVCYFLSKIRKQYYIFVFYFSGVDQEFEKLMNSIFGTEIMDEFKIKRPAGYVDLMIAFEARKRTASPFKNNPLNISLPFSFIDFYKKKKVKLFQLIYSYACSLNNKNLSFSFFITLLAISFLFYFALFLSTQFQNDNLRYKEKTTTQDTLKNVCILSYCRVFL